MPGRRLSLSATTPYSTPTPLGVFPLRPHRPAKLIKFLLPLHTLSNASMETSGKVLALPVGPPQSGKLRSKPGHHQRIQNSCEKALEENL